MRLEAVSVADLPLYEAMFCSEVYMKELGGPTTKEKAHEMLMKQIKCHTDGDGLVYKIVPTAEDYSPDDISIADLCTEQGVGTVCLWKGEWHGDPVTEIGWGVAPSFVGRHYGTNAVKLLLKLAMSDGRWGVIHAFTSVTNYASHAICRNCGFKFEGEEIMTYDGHNIPAYHYLFDTSKG